MYTMQYLASLVLALYLTMSFHIQPALAAVDKYVARFLQAQEPVSLALNDQGATKEFTATDLSAGKLLFEQHCLNCHVGGATVPNPIHSLSLQDLRGANPPRDNIEAIVAFLREPMDYTGEEVSYWCRQVPPSWMPQAEIEKLAAFILRAAQKAPGWGTDKFDNL